VDQTRDLSADGDEDDNYFIQAWQAMAQALAASDADDDKSGILQVMNLIKNLLLADGTGQSLPTSSAFAHRCDTCARVFATETSHAQHQAALHS
jgi:hypothetical protein